MAWWKCSNALRFNPVVDEILKANNNNGYGLAREAIFYHLLGMSAENYKFSGAEHLAKMVNAPDKQCQIVWDVCIKHKVLRQIEDGVFSAIEWMKEEGLMPSKFHEPRKPKIKPIESPCILEPVEVPKPKPEKAIQITDSNPYKNEIKEQVRPNVRLTRNEIISLKEQFSDKQIAEMLDILSEFKTNSGKTYPSDYAALNRWVIKRVCDESAPTRLSASKTGESFPEWIYGKSAAKG